MILSKRNFVKLARKVCRKNMEGGAKDYPIVIISNHMTREK